MILGLFWMLVANAAVLLAARAALRRLATGNPALDLVLFLLLRFGFIMGLVLAAGLTGILSPAGLGLPCAAGLALLLARGERFDIPWKAPIPRELSRWAIVFLAALVVRGLVLTVFYTPIDGDATSYHLPKVAEWVRAGSFRVDLGTDARAWFPGGFELVETWWVLFLHHDALIELAGQEFLFLSGASVWATARWAGLGTGGALLASLVTVSTPGLSTQSLACLNDGPAAALVMAGVALIVGRAPAALLVFLGGMAAGLKPTTIYAAPGLLLLYIAVRKDPPAPATTSRVLSRGLAVFGLLLGAYWYLRTWILMGHPLYPMGTSAIHAAPGTPLQRLGPSLSGLAKNISDLANLRIYDGRRPLHPLLEHAAGWGPAVVACGLPALMAGLRRLPRLRILGLAFGISLATVLALVVNDRFNLRFVLWFPLLPGIALGAFVERVPRMALPAAIAMAFSFLSATLTGQYPLATLKIHLRNDRFTDGGFWILYAEPAARVGTFGSLGQRSYLFYGPDYRNEVVTIRARTPEELEAEMIRLGLSQLYAYDLPPKSVEVGILAECVRRGWLLHIAPSTYFLPP